MDALGSRTLCSELINMFVFEVLQICTGCTKFDVSALCIFATPWLWGWWMENIAHMGQISQSLTFRGPCIVTYSYNKTNEMH